MNEPNEDIINSPDYREVYCNSTRTRVSPWDVGLLFGQMKQTKNGDTVHESHTQVSMSPQHFKALVSSLNTILMAWEIQFGTINFKPEFVQSNVDGLNKAIADAQAKATHKS